MERRKFILNSLLASSSLVLAPSVFAACRKKDKPIDTDKKVVVIGGGISGLAAAKYLHDRKVEVRVLEAQDKVGGRIRTNRSLGVAFDEGASWIHGPTGNPITDIGQSAGVNTFLTDDENVEVFDTDGSKYTTTQLEDAYDEFETALNQVQNSGVESQSFESVFNSLFPQHQNNRLWTYMLSAYLEFDTGSDISKLSSLDFYDDDEYKGDDVILTNGYDKVTDWLSSDLNVSFNTSVSKINYTGDTITITTNSGTVEADYVIIAVPLGVLKNNVIEFSPVLPTDKSSAIGDTNMGVVNKFMLTWDSPFWNTNLQYIGYTPAEKGKFNYFMNMNKFASTNALMTFAFGDYALATESMTDAEVTDEIMAHLKTMYGSTIPSPTNLLRTKWGTNPYTFGAYSYATNGSRSKDFDTLANSVSDKLFFAGEHTNRDFRGTVHGAYESGLREAEKIADLL